ncbi:MAG: NrfD/PsrC family molybdoenzyme membrane anchor subunit [Desulfonatronovibrionaceae bacterium]
MTHKHSPHPIQTRFWTPGVIVLACFMAAGAVALAARLTAGLGYATNLSNAYPWGIWIGIDVATGVALAAGGFSTAALAHIFGGHRFEPITRPALLTAALGYTFVALGVVVDIGRPWAVWKPIFFQNHTSALFEVAMCVMTYLTVLWLEFIPIAAEKYGQKIRILGLLGRFSHKIMSVLIILGVVLSFMHQSSLGTLMLIAPTKLHPLWYTPILPLMFLMSAISVGYAMVIFETSLATRSLGLESEMNVLTPLSRLIILFLGLYIAVKTGDMLFRGTYAYLLQGNSQSNSFLLEFGLGALVPWLLLLSPRIRSSRGWLFAVSCMVVGGVVLNRVNVFLIGYTPPVSTGPYFPSFAELLVTAGFIASIMFLYRAGVTFLPVLSAGKKEVAQ